MDIEFFGATDRVTGSCHILRCNGYTVLLDCGLIQGSREASELNRKPFPFEPDQLDAVILSHGHIDHSGRLPLLVNRGYKGEIHCQNATLDLTEVLLKDSAKLQEQDANYYNRKRKKKGEEPREPLYREQDAKGVFRALRGHPYRESFEPLPGIEVCFYNAGHILGSSIVQLKLLENGIARTLVFSGDIGQYDTPIINDPCPVDYADLLIMESTYGNRLHRERRDTIAEIGDILEKAHREGGNVLIPAFAIGRSQELLYLLGERFDEWQMERWQVYLDSPMAITASKIYWEYPHLYDPEATKFRRDLLEMPTLTNLRLTQSVDDSKAIANHKGGAIIIAGSGMCNGGRILHHLRNNLEKTNTHVIICGYQSPGTLGGRLVRGEEEVRIHGRWVKNKAQVHTVGGLSAHGDQKDLQRWMSGFKNAPRLFAVHGNEDGKKGLIDMAKAEFSWDAQIASEGQRVEV
ncbi:MAG: MBL fold metallo-hydrolase RNA specificity domain-containing protein [Granulosicoccaceae bacterium]